MPSRPLLYALFTKQVASLRAQIASQQASGLPVYVTGDFNIGYAQDRKVELKKNPYRNLTGLREVATWQNKPLSAKGTFMDPVCRPGVKYWAPTSTRPGARPGRPTPRCSQRSSTPTTTRSARRT